MHSNRLRREITSRHIFFISVGSAIGTGLFYGSAASIKLAGPSAILAYIISGIIIYIVMRCLGEITVEDPSVGGFSHYASKYLNEYFGFLTGWSYIFEILLVCLADITAVSIYFKYFFPNIPFFCWAIILIVGIGVINLLGVKIFAELESFLSFIKIAAIIAMILSGLLLIIIGIIQHKELTHYISNLWEIGGFFPNGISGFLSSFPIVIFAFGGIEIIALLSAETKNRNDIPKAINNIPLRILLFYVMSLFVIISLIPWNQIDDTKSPFILIFHNFGFENAAVILNIIVIISGMSAINSDIFGITRILLGMSEKKHAPKFLNQLSSRGVPSFSIIIIMTILFLGLLLNYIIPDDVFIFIASLASFSTIFVWIMIVLSQIGFRINNKIYKGNNLIFPIFLWPMSSIIALISLSSILIGMMFFEETKLAIYMGVLWVFIISLIWLLCKKYRKVSN